MADAINVDISKLQLLKNEMARIFLLKKKRPDIFVIQETHFSTTNIANFPKHFLDFKWVHHPAAPDDPGGGTSIAYSFLLPNPHDLTFVLLNKELIHLEDNLPSPLLGSVDELSSIPGRVFILQFSFTGQDLLIGAIYGHASGPAKAKYNLIENAHTLLELAQELPNNYGILPSLISPRKIQILGGDFNAFSCADNSFSYESNNSKTLPVANCRNDCEKCAIHRLISTHDYVHARGATQPPSYHTNITYHMIPGGKGTFSTCKTGIDHIFIKQNCSHRLTKFYRVRMAVEPDLYGKKRDSLTSHDLLAVDLKVNWVNPLGEGKDHPGSAFQHIPSRVFFEDKFVAAIIVKLKFCLNDRSHSGELLHNINWADRWDSFVDWLRPLAFKQEKIIRDKIANELASLRKELNIRREKFEHNCSHPNFIEFQHLHSKFFALQHGLMQNQGERTKRVFPTHFDKDEDIAHNRAMLYQKEKLNGLDSVLPGFLDAEKVFQSDPACMQNIAYTSLKEKFAAPAEEKTLKHNISSFFSSLGGTSRARKVSPEQAAALAKPYTCDDALEAAQYLKVGTTSITTAPGIDGITSGLFSNPRLAVYMANFLANICNYIAKTGIFPKWFKTVAIRLLAKKDRDTVNVLDTRPISLLSLALRIITRMITNRLAPLMSSLIRPSQRGFVPGRRMDFNTAILQMAINESLLTAGNGTIGIEADFLAAYDSIYHQFLRKTLLFFGLPLIMVNLIMFISTSLEGQAIINGMLTEKFPLNKGVPQGSSLSCFCFLFCLEIAFIMADQNAEIKGIKFENYMLTLLAFADDLWIFLENNIVELKAWFSIFNSFKGLSGLALSDSKSRIHLIGSVFQPLSPANILNHAVNPTALDDRKNQLVLSIAAFTKCPVITDNRVFKYLGLHYSIEDRVDEALKLDLTTSSWSQRVSNLRPFINLVRSTPCSSFTTRGAFTMEQVLSRVWHMARVSECPPTIISVLQKMVADCVFKVSHSPPVKLQIACQEATLGGCNLPNVALRMQALQLDWVFQFIKGYLPKELNNLFRFFLFQCVQAVTKFEEQAYSRVLSIPDSNMVLLESALVYTKSLCGNSKKVICKRLESFFETQSYVLGVWKKAFITLQYISIFRELPAVLEEVRKIPDNILILNAVSILKEPIWSPLFMNQVGKGPGKCVICFAAVGINLVRDLIDITTMEINCASIIAFRITTVVKSPRFPGTDYEKRLLTEWNDDRNSFVRVKDFHALVPFSNSPQDLNLSNKAWGLLFPPRWKEILLQVKTKNLTPAVMAMFTSSNPGVSETHFVYSYPDTSKQTATTVDIKKWRILPFSDLTTKKAYLLLCRLLYVNILPTSDSKIKEKYPTGQFIWDSILKSLPDYAEINHASWDFLWHTFTNYKEYNIILLHYYYLLLHGQLCIKTGGRTNPVLPDRHFMPCPFCNGSLCDPLHYIFNCPGVKHFWKSFSKQLYSFDFHTDKATAVLNQDISMRDILFLGHTRADVSSRAPSPDHRDIMKRLLYLAAIHAIVHCHKYLPKDTALDANAHAKAIHTQFLRVMTTHLTSRLLYSQPLHPSPWIQHDLFYECFPWIIAATDGNIPMSYADYLLVEDKTVDLPTLTLCIQVPLLTFDGSNPWRLGSL